ncbi:hypothetical protein HK405_015834, partial [Cladochytrium tenue]
MPSPKAYRNSAEILGEVKDLHKSTVDFLGRLLRTRDRAVESLKNMIEEYIRHSTDVIEFLYDHRKRLTADEAKMEKKLITYELDGTKGVVAIFASDTIPISWFKTHLSSKHDLRGFDILIKSSEDTKDDESAPFNQDDQTFSRLVDENRTFVVVRARSSSGAGNPQGSGAGNPQVSVAGNPNKWKKYVAAAYKCGKGSTTHTLTVCYADCDSEFIAEVSKKLSVQPHFAAIRKTCLKNGVDWIQRIQALGSNSMALFICSTKAVEEFAMSESNFLLEIEVALELFRERRLSVMPIYFDHGLTDDQDELPDVNHKHLASPKQYTIRTIRKILSHLASKKFPHES